MGIIETSIIYCLVGLACAIALFLAGHRRLWMFGLHVLAWPFFAPALLSSSDDLPVSLPSPQTDARIRVAEAGLLRAIDQLEGVAEEVLAPEIAAIRELTRNLEGVERRITDMDRLLASPEFDPERADATRDALCARGVDVTDSRLQSVASRQRNIVRLQAMRARAADDLERATLKMEEMSAQILILRFAERPETALSDLVREIAATVEGVSNELLSLG